METESIAAAVAAYVEDAPRRNLREALEALARARRAAARVIGRRP